MVDTIAPIWSERLPSEATMAAFSLVCSPRSRIPSTVCLTTSNPLRVAAAACFLPLSVNPAISKDFGTRHRAAIGLTEDVDAVAIVVSEETGRITLALDGQVERGLDAVAWVKVAAAVVDGGGGGRPDMAQAGGPEGDKLAEALAAIKAALG